MPPDAPAPRTGSGSGSASGDGPAIEISGVSCAFATRRGTLRALGPIDLEVTAGEFLGIVGPSGCGKSTLLRLIAGLASPTSGQIVLRTSGRSRTPIALVFQDYGIYPWKTVEANVRFGLDLTGVRKSEGRERARHWLQRLGLADVADFYPAQLSGGMRQRVSIARALAVEPEVLLMDEPFAALDAQLREILQEDLLALCQADQRTVLFVTHSLEEAIVLSDRVAVMTARPGRILDFAEIDLPRPRESQVRETAAFGQIRRQLWDLLRHEVDVQMARTSTQ